MNSFFSQIHFLNEIELIYLHTSIAIFSSQENQEEILDF